MTEHGSQIIRALEAAWMDIQRRHPEVPSVVFITGSGKALKGGDRWGHFGAGRWTTTDGRAPELFVAGELLAGGHGFASPGHRVFKTMLHEAAHGVAQVRGVKDCSRAGNRYHNGKFRDIAVELGLTAPNKPDSGYGWSFVSLGEEVAAAYADTIATLNVAIPAYLEDWTAAAGGTGNGEDDEEGEEGKPRKRAGQRVAVECECLTPRRLQITPKQLEEAPILCGACGAEFTAEETGAEAQAA